MMRGMVLLFRERAEERRNSRLGARGGWVSRCERPRGVRPWHTAKELPTISIPHIGHGCPCGRGWRSGSF